MSNAAKNRVLTRLLGKRVVFSGKFPWGERERMQAMAEAQQALIGDDVDAKTDFLVHAGAAGKTVQKKVMTLNAKGAAIQVLDSAAFIAMAQPTQEEVLALIRRGGKQSAAILAKATGQLHDYHYRSTKTQLVTFASEGFDGLDMGDFNLSQVEFDHCSFRATELSGASFFSARDCDFSEAKGTAVSFETVDSCRFSNATFKQAHFHSAIPNCDFSSASLEGAVFRRDHYRSVRSIPTIPTGVTFDHAILKGATFQNIPLQSPRFEWADLTSVTFTSCDLDNANFRHATLRNATMVGSKLRGSDFTAADLQGANLADADLTGATMDGADIAGCNLRGATLTGVDLSKAKNYDPNAAPAGTIGPALMELDALVTKAKRIQVQFHVSTGTSNGDQVGIDSNYLRYGWGLTIPASIGRSYHHSSGKSISFSSAMLQLATILSHKCVRYETISISSTKSPKGGKELREVVIQAIAEAFAQPVPAEEDLAKLTKAWRDEQSEKTAADRERREAAKKAAEQAKARATKQIAKKIEKAVGKVTDIATFLKALELRADKQKIDKATKMLKAERFKLFNDIGEEHLAGVVKSQTDPDLVYACRVDSEGQYACCTQNLNICGGLRGSICKHLLVLIIGLVKAGELDPTTIDAWVARTHDAKPELNKETMGEIFIRYKGAEAGEVDWRPTETVPEDYYAL